MPPHRSWHQTDESYSPSPWPVPEFPTETNAIWKRVAQIDPARYSKTRNFINGSLTYLSPYISRGVISTGLTKKVWLF